MRLFRSPVLLRRALGVSLLSGLLGWWAHHWRAHIEDSYGYSTSTYDAANNLMHTFWGVSVLALVYVGLCLVLTRGAGHSDE